MSFWLLKVKIVRLDAAVNIYKAVPYRITTVLFPAGGEAFHLAKYPKRRTTPPNKFHPLGGFSEGLTAGKYSLRSAQIPGRPFPAGAQPNGSRFAVYGGFYGLAD